MNFDDILDSVSKDFFGSSDDYYKEMIKGGTLEDLEKQLAELRAKTGVPAETGAENSTAQSGDSEGSSTSDSISENIKILTEKLAKLDAMAIGEKPASSGAAPTQASPENTACVSAAEQAQAPNEDEKSGMQELNELIGLDGIKHDVKELVSFMKVQKLRQEKGGKSVPVSLHLVFTGNPGTGKTTIARILAKLYKEIGVLSKGQLVEVDRSGLVAGYVGQTAIKTQQKIQEALGGILFIDEAYALNKEGNDYGQEAIDTILKAMEDHRDDFIVIVAGYTDLMNEFINSNPGLKSRFNKYIEFPDYTEEELEGIFMLRVHKYGYELTDEALAALRQIIHTKVENKDPNFANAREMRNLFEAVVTNQATRIADMDDLTDELLNCIEAADFEEFI